MSNGDGKTPDISEVPQIGVKRKSSREILDENRNRMQRMNYLRSSNAEISQQQMTDNTSQRAEQTGDSEAESKKHAIVLQLERLDRKFSFLDGEFIDIQRTLQDIGQAYPHTQLNTDSLSFVSAPENPVTKITNMFDALDDMEFESEIHHFASLYTTLRLDIQSDPTFQNLDPRSPLHKEMPDMNKGDENIQRFLSAFRDMKKYHERNRLLVSDQVTYNFYSNTIKDKFKAMEKLFSAIANSRCQVERIVDVLYANGAFATGWTISGPLSDW